MQRRRTVVIGAIDLGSCVQKSLDGLLRALLGGNLQGSQLPEAPGVEVRIALGELPDRCWDKSLALRGDRCAYRVKKRVATGVGCGCSWTLRALPLSLVG